MYSIIRFYQDGNQATIKMRLTLEEAQEHCNDPETSSRTCEELENTEHTEKHGPWFDGYREE